jgi:hypothetical protein
MDPLPVGRERRKLPDPVTFRFLLTWVLFLGLLSWGAWRFLRDAFFVNVGGSWALTAGGAVSLYAGSVAAAVAVTLGVYRVKYGRTFAVEVLRVVRGILSLFLLTAVFFWPVSMMLAAMDVAYMAWFIGAAAVTIALLSLVVRLARPPEMGFWRDWLNDTLLRW